MAHGHRLAAYLGSSRIGMALIWALSAALGFGIADLCAREASQGESSLKTLLYLYIIGIPAAAMLLVFNEAGRRHDYISWMGLAGAAAGLIIALGTICLYRALVIGPLLIVAPIASSFAVVTFVLSLLSGERPTPLQMIGLMVTLGGVILATLSSGPGRDADGRPVTRGPSRLVSAGVMLAIGTALLHGLGFWLLRYIVPVLGSQATVLVMRVSTLPFLILFFMASRIPLRLKSASSLKWLIPVGVLDTAASWFYNLAVDTGLTSIVSVITSLYSVVTVVLGYLLWQERITRIQQVGVLITMAGIAMVSV
jgi:drug/metabolite transporter (DMT)-like permease